MIFMAEKTAVVAAADLDAELGELREYFYSGKTKEESWRRSQLRGILSLVKDREDELLRALRQDLGKHAVEAYRDEVSVEKSCI